MSEQERFPGATLWRIAAGVLAVVAVAVGLLRLYLLAVGGVPEGGSWVTSVLRLVFPLGIGLAFGYVALSSRFWRREETPGGKEGE